jgi:molybdopterin molybdotransferase
VPAVQDPNRAEVYPLNELFTVLPPSEAFRALAERLGPVSGTERVDTPRALGRVSAEPIVAGEMLPAFARSAMDGYAVRASETYGASDASPAYFRFGGEVLMGTVAREPLAAGGAIRVHTGAMIPPGADAVVIVEETNARGEEVEVLRAVAPGENVIRLGEDVRGGETVWEAGAIFRTQDLGALHALGITSVEVRRKPRVGILSTGDEVVPPKEKPPLGSVRDVNAVTIATTVERAGGTGVYFGIHGDDEERLVRAARAALDESDMLVLSAGSSVSARDVTERAIARLGSPGVLVHGIAIRPGKPTILALCDGKPVIGLPGNPASAFVVAWRIVRPLVRVLLGVSLAASEEGDHVVEARLATSLPSRPGREDYVPATLQRLPDGTLEATPLFGKSSLIFTLVRADGLIAVPLDLGGLSPGDTVRVIVP